MELSLGLRKVVRSVLIVGLPNTRCEASCTPYCRVSDTILPACSELVLVLQKLSRSATTNNATPTRATTVVVRILKLAS